MPIFQFNSLSLVWAFIFVAVTIAATEANPSSAAALDPKKICTNLSSNKILALGMVQNKIAVITTKLIGLTADPSALTADTATVRLNLANAAPLNLSYVTVDSTDRACLGKLKNETDLLIVNKNKKIVTAIPVGGGNPNNRALANYKQSTDWSALISGDPEMYMLKDDVLYKVLISEMKGELKLNLGVLMQKLSAPSQIEGGFVYKEQLYGFNNTQSKIFVYTKKGNSMNMSAEVPYAEFFDCAKTASGGDGGGGVDGSDSTTVTTKKGFTLWIWIGIIVVLLGAIILIISVVLFVCKFGKKKLTTRKSKSGSKKSKKVSTSGKSRSGSRSSKSTSSGSVSKTGSIKKLSSKLSSKLSLKGVGSDSGPAISVTEVSGVSAKSNK